MPKDLPLPGWRVYSKYPERLYRSGDGVCLAFRRVITEMGFRSPFPKVQLLLLSVDGSYSF
jgi:hypothetical protein